MAAQIAKFSFVDEVIFVNPIRSLRRARVKPKVRHGSGLKPGSGFLPSASGSNIRLYSPCRFLPFKRWLPVLKRVEDRFFLRAVNQMNQDRPFVLLINDPIKSSDYLLQNLLKHARLSIFDFSDDFVEYFVDPKDPRRFRCLENIRKYAGAADLVLTVNQYVKEKYRYVNAHMEVVRNATNYDNFERETYQPVDFMEPIKQLGQPIAGYSGGIREVRVDFDLLDNIIGSKSEWQFVFIGDADRAFMKRYQKVNNVHVFPPVDYEQLPDCINYFDVSFIPFRFNEHTKGNDLLKLYDYLAMGKPVVSTRFGEDEVLKKICFIADSSKAFAEKMDLAINANTMEYIAQRKLFAQKNSWNERIKEIEKLVVDRLSC